MNTLKEILVDAARYRWLRENLWVVGEMLSVPDDGGVSGRYLGGCEFDSLIDAELTVDN